MSMNSQTINEDRGARRAEELRRRFAHVSNSSIRRPKFGLRQPPARPAWGESRARRAQLNEFLAWSSLAGVVVFIGFLIF